MAIYILELCVPTLSVRDWDKSLANQHVEKIPLDVKETVIPITTYTYDDGEEHFEEDYDPVKMVVRISDLPYYLETNDLGDYDIIYILSVFVLGNIPFTTKVHDWIPEVSEIWVYLPDILPSLASFQFPRTITEESVLVTPSLLPCREGFIFLASVEAWAGARDIDLATAYKDLDFAGITIYEAGYNRGFTTFFDLYDLKDTIFW
jgi:hypothetical protein